jgi:hypothetical protein
VKHFNAIMLLREKFVSVEGVTYGVPDAEHGLTLPSSIQRQGITFLNGLHETHGHLPHGHFPGINRRLHSLGTWCCPCRQWIGVRRFPD